MVISRQKDIIGNRISNIGIAKTCFDVFNILAVLLMVDNCFIYLIISSRAAKAIR